VQLTRQLRFVRLCGSSQKIRPLRRVRWPQADALVDIAELVETLQGQDPPPAGFRVGRLALRWRPALRKCSSASSGSIRRPWEHAFKAAAGKYSMIVPWRLRRLGMVWLSRPHLPATLH